MRGIRLRRRHLLAGSLAAVTALGTATALAAAGPAATAAVGARHPIHRTRPGAARRLRAAAAAAATAYPVTSVTQEFGTSTTPFCPAGTGNAPCDGAANDYGTIDRVPSGFSNGGAGNYAPSAPALTGGWLALVSGTTVQNQGLGCPGTSTEECSGPYALFGTGAAQGVENVFPAKGFTVTDDLYLSPSTAPKSGSLVDDDVELNTSSGQYGIDNIITACPVPGGFVINFGNNSPGSCAGTPQITTAGWYRFVFNFTDNGGNAYLTESVHSEPRSKLVVTSGSQPVGGSPTPVSSWGGPGYFWLPTENISGLPLANFALQLGNEPLGHTP